MTEIERLRTRIFVFYGSEPDEKIFRYKIRQWVLQGSPTTVFKLAWNLVKDANKMSLKDKYLRKRGDKMFVERAFIKWVRLAVEEIENEVELKTV